MRGGWGPLCTSQGIEAIFPSRSARLSIDRARTMTATASELLTHFRELGYEIRPRGNQLVISPASDGIPPHLLDALKLHKAAILELLSPKTIVIQRRTELEI